MADQKKNKRIGLRCSKRFVDMLTVICLYSGKTKTTVIEELILAEFKRKKEYDALYIQLQNEESDKKWREYCEKNG